MNAATLICLFISLLSVGSVRAQYDYELALKKSILFYEAQRSGKLTADNRISWRGDSFLNDANGIDLSQGYFDAGDQMKYGFPLGHTMIFLAWGMIDYKDAYVAAGEYENGLNAVRWGTDWILKASKEVGNNIVYAQVGDTTTDHDYWGRPEEFPTNLPRPAMTVTAQKPGTDLASNYASALAAASILFRDADPTYSATCLSVARQLYDFADKYRGKYSVSVPDAADNYGSSEYEDELTFAAAMMAWATGEQSYRTAAANFWTQFGFGSPREYFDWDGKNAGIAILMSRILGDQKYKTSAQNNCEYWINTSRRTPLGLVFIDRWASLNLAMGAAYGCLMVADLGVGNAANYRAFAKQQVDYALGSTGRSFVVGFGVNPPQYVHHAAASCPDRPAPCDWSTYSSPLPNGQIINGALVGGPDARDSYDDSRDNYVQNEVAIDYNAAFQSVLASILQAKLKGFM